MSIGLILSNEHFTDDIAMNVAMMALQSMQQCILHYTGSLGLLHLGEKLCGYGGHGGHGGHGDHGGHSGHGVMVVMVVMAIGVEA